MPVDFTGYWKMLANENFEEYLRALDVNVALRKIANLLKPDKEIVQDGDHMIIRTLSTFRNYIMDFQVGKEFEEDLTGIDDRKCMMQFSMCRYAHFADENLRLREVKNLFDPRSQPAGGRGRILTGLFIKMRALKLRRLLSLPSHSSRLETEIPDHGELGRGQARVCAEGGKGGTRLDPMD
ncbi:retinol-binding protein 1 isoform X2 [Panthera leo]|uniref:retinol-binding protein 1 isoform X2 n=1 Tax=Panthera leo TaxID=9689 RepID=UPI001C6A3B01|nr:retinol-binding protein 1 isoform X2 [Panthera leo]